DIWGLGDGFRTKFTLSPTEPTTETETVARLAVGFEFA
ncbi:hypothetical protein CCACVL1_13924, partial [Corchorus capsularis]